VASKGEEGLAKGDLRSGFKFWRDENTLNWKWKGRETKEDETMMTRRPSRRFGEADSQMEIGIQEGEDKTEGAGPGEAPTALIREWMGGEQKAAQAWAAIQAEAFALLGGLSSLGAAVLREVSGVRASVQALHERMGRVEARLEAVELKDDTVSKQLTGFGPKMAAVEQNLAQMRVQIGRVGDRVGELSDEFIERHVREPLLIGIGALYNEARRDGENGIGGRVAEILMERIRELLALYDARVIEPGEGAEFNPHEHQPVRRIATWRRDLDRRIACVDWAGFGRNGRVLQQARVALFSREGTRHTNKTNEGGNPNETSSPE
jgi:hypothetical protein